MSIKLTDYKDDDYYKFFIEMGIQEDLSYFLGKYLLTFRPPYYTYSLNYFHLIPKINLKDLDLGIEYFLENNNIKNDIRPVETYLAEYGDYDLLINYLKSKNQDLNFKSKELFVCDIYKTNIFHYLCKSGNTESIIKFYKNFPFYYNESKDVYIDLFNTTNYNKNTVWHYLALSRNFFSFIKIIDFYHKNVKKTNYEPYYFCLNKYGASPAHFFGWSGSSFSTIHQVLAFYNIKNYENHLDNSNKNIFHYLAWSGNYNVFLKCVDEYKIDLGKIQYPTYFHLLAKSGNYTLFKEIIPLYIQKFGQLNECFDVKYKFNTSIYNELLRTNPYLLANLINDNLIDLRSNWLINPADKYNLNDFKDYLKIISIPYKYEDHITNLILYCNYHNFSEEILIEEIRLNKLDFICQISLNIFRDPLLIDTGINIDRSQYDLLNPKKCPIKRTIIKTYIPNFPLKQNIIEFLENYIKININPDFNDKIISDFIKSKINSNFYDIDKIKKFLDLST